MPTHVGINRYRLFLGKGENFKLLKSLEYIYDDSTGKSFVPCVTMSHKRIVA